MNGIEPKVRRCMEGLRCLEGSKGRAADISHRGNRSIRCESCQSARDEDAKRRSAQKAYRRQVNGETKSVSRYKRTGGARSAVGSGGVPIDLHNGFLKSIRPSRTPATWR